MSNIKELSEKEKSIYIAGIFEGMELLAKDLKGSCGFTAGNQISTVRYKFLKENPELLKTAKG